MKLSDRATKLLFGVALAAVLAACAAEEEIGQCEPGVEGLSQSSSMIPQGC